MDLLKTLLGNGLVNRFREDKFLVNNPLLGNDSVNTSRGNEYATIKVVFSVRDPCREDIIEYGNRSSHTYIHTYVHKFNNM
jgi:hypothetical protein